MCASKLKSTVEAQLATLAVQVFITHTCDPSSACTIQFLPFSVHAGTQLRAIQFLPFSVHAGTQLHTLLVPDPSVLLHGIQ